jgi:hypothetical protein
MRSNVGVRLADGADDPGGHPVADGAVLVVAGVLTGVMARKSMPSTGTCLRMKQRRAAPVTIASATSFTPPPRAWRIASIGSSDMPSHPCAGWR